MGKEKLAYTYSPVEVAKKYLGWSEEDVIRMQSLPHKEGSWTIGETIEHLVEKPTQERMQMLATFGPGIVARGMLEIDLKLTPDQLRFCLYASTIREVPRLEMQLTHYEMFGKWFMGENMGRHIKERIADGGFTKDEELQYLREEIAALKHMKDELMATASLSIESR